MARIRLSIDSAVLAELEEIRRREGKALGRLVSELLAEALAERRARAGAGSGLDWISKPIRSRIDLADKNALYPPLDG